MSASGVIRRFSTTTAARAALLPGRGHLAVSAEALPAAVRAGIQSTFGADLSAEQVVQRVLADVRQRGDAAVCHYTQAFDHAAVTELLVDAARIDDAVERVGPTVMAAL